MVLQNRQVDHAIANLRERLRKQAACRAEDREVRLAAVWGLANLADADSIGLLLKAADTEANYERIKATQACLLLAEKLTAAGNKRAAAWDNWRQFKQFTFTGIKITNITANMT